jgi:hypothetical protein
VDPPVEDVSFGDAAKEGFSHAGIPLWSVTSVVSSPSESVDPTMRNPISHPGTLMIMST